MLKSSLKDYPDWIRVVNAEKASSSFSKEGLATWQPDLAAQWRHLQQSVRSASRKEQALSVNGFFNLRPYVTDQNVWGVEEHWARPLDFMRLGGDCEDYAIAKYFALRELGIPTDALRIAAVWNSARKEGHAVLVINIDNQEYLLDNLENDLPLQSAVHWYAPAYYLNEEFQWTFAVRSEVPQLEGQ